MMNEIKMDCDHEVDSIKNYFSDSSVFMEIQYVDSPYSGNIYTSNDLLIIFEIFIL